MAPFDAALVVLLAMTVVTVTTWTENYGDTASNTKASVKAALNHIMYNPKVFCLGAIQGLFEGAMYTWVREGKMKDGCAFCNWLLTIRQ